MTMITRARWWWRRIVRYLTGRRWTVPLPDRKALSIVEGRRLVRNVIGFLGTRRHANRALLTSVVVGYLTGMTLRHREPDYRSAFRPRTYFKRGTRYRQVGRPMVLEHRIEPKDPTRSVRIVRTGLTEFSVTYVPRAEVLAARRIRKRVTSTSRG